MLTRPIKPAAGQESVWDYPRPPRLEPTEAEIKIFFNNTLLADTKCAWRVLETSHPPVYYLPPKDIQMQFLVKSPGASFCEWKGVSQYYSVIIDNISANRIGWYYKNPVSKYSAIKDHVAFYAGAMDACYVNNEKVKPQPGGFYGGWITKNIVGPFKGDPGTLFW